MTNSLNWLHLTDLHWGLAGQKHLFPIVRDEFFKDLRDLARKAGPWHLVLFTGDLVQSGRKKEFENLQQRFLGPLWKFFDDEFGINPVMLAVPGNHGRRGE